MQRSEMEDDLDRELLNEMLIENPAEYLDLIEDSEYLIVTLTPEGSIYYINPKWLKTLGYTTAQIKNAPFLDVVKPGDRNRFRETIERVLESRANEYLSFEISSKDGRTFAVEGNISCFCDFDQPSALRGYFRPASGKPEKTDDRSKLPLERVFLKFYDKGCSIAEPCLDD